MKQLRILLFSLFFVPVAGFAAGNEFNMAAQLLAAAKNADIQQVQSLVNAGANVNYVDNTGLSIVCTAIKNNDIRAAQILQTYGADASQCDRQIKNYNKKLPKTESGGLFSGLSNAQGIALAAAGAAVVVGGLFFLTDMLDSSNNNSGISTTDDSRGTDGDDGDTTTSTKSFTTPFGPAMTTSAQETSNYSANLNYYSPSATGILKDNFALMTDSYGQNYLLMMHGYSALARGYLGMRTLRNSSTYAPLDISGYQLGADNVLGGRPVNVALVTDNGINAATNTSLEDELLPWTTTSSATTLNAASNDKISSKYYNNAITYGASTGSLVDDTTAEDASDLNVYDLANYGTVVNNTLATSLDNLLAKVINGRTSGYSSADYFGFMPNGQLTVFRTGGGKGMSTLTTTVANSGTITDEGDTKFGDDDTLSLFGYNLTVALNSNNANGFSAKLTGAYTDIDNDDTFNNGDTVNLYTYGMTVTMTTDSDLTDTKEPFTMTDGTHTYNGYINTATSIVYVDTDTNGTYDQEFSLATSGVLTYNYYGYVGADDLLYIDSDGDGVVDKAYTIETDNSLTLTKEEGAMDYLNYKALLKAGLLWYAGDLAEGKSKPDVLANASIVPGLYDRDAKTISDILSISDPDNWSGQFSTFVNDYYDVNLTDGSGGSDDLPGTAAVTFFNNLGSTYSPLVIFSTGAAETDSSYSGATLQAGFENSAPLVFDNLEHLFMSVVAVGDSNTTASTSNVSGYSVNGKIKLSQWRVYDEDTASYTYYKSRVCGIGGTGSGTIDPWCFAAAGVTDELAVASMAGAAGALKSAFSYMNNKQIFALLALTADGPYLGTSTSGTAYTESTLIAYLKDMYEMPNEFTYRWQTGGENYLDVFKEVFGYGLINLERATTPSKSVYYYNGTDIVSDSGNGYWRSASATTFKTSKTLSVSRAASISASSYDILTSVDGTLSLPRIWENEFAIDSGSAGLYMGDVLGEFDVIKNNDTEFKQGNLSVKMGFSEKAYIDNMNGLNNLKFSYESGNMNFSGGYQRHFTDGLNRFDGTSNPVLSMAANSVYSDFNYNVSENLTFGMRGFNGAITDEALLENDPTISSQYTPATLGLIQGGESNVRIGNKKVGLTTSVGFAHETDTLLGAQTTGVLALGNGNTTYIDTVLNISPVDYVDLSLRSTFAKTKSNPSGELIMGMSDIESNSFAAGLDIGKFGFTAAMPLSVIHGDFDYAAADYSIISDADENYDIAANVGIENLSLVPDKREIRFTGSYRESLGEFTDGALGFIYRVNPNNTDEYGNESIFMLKVSHRIGI